MDTAPKDIIVPVDGSDHAGAAARYAARLAQALTAELHLVHAFPGSIKRVMETLGRTPRHASAERMTAETFETLRNGSARRAFQHARSYLPADSSITEHVLDGEPSDAIAAFVGDGHEVQVVMGRRGIGRVRELFLGSVSERVILRVDQPVTVVTAGREAGETRDGKPAPLVVPVDGSDAAHSAVVHGVSLARRTGAALHLLHAFPGLASLDPAFNSSVSLTNAAPLSRAELGDMARLSANEAFATARAAITDSPEEMPRIVEVRRDGPPARAVTEYVQSLGTAEVIIGRRGLGRVQGLLLGSVSQRVLHGAECPVTVIG